jgi:hypothetical protein
MCEPGGKVVRVGPEILDESRFICGCDVGADVVEGRHADGLKIERRPIPGHELPARGTSQDTATPRRPLDH